MKGVKIFGVLYLVASLIIHPLGLAKNPKYPWYMIFFNPLVFLKEILFRNTGQIVDNG